jgi:hypothetical protein
MHVQFQLYIRKKKLKIIILRHFHNNISSQPKYPHNYEYVKMLPWFTIHIAMKNQKYKK